ncbi:MAG TPA: 4-hydroxy-tetrahydrodipicolinate reductase [Myxococcota bacterium]|nr:4-hydroxy-tetrahydrodipicolinate reductase [Myxococcota bacterium]
MTPLVICGALGRMGQSVIDLARKSDNYVIKAGVVKSLLKSSTGDCPFPLFHDLDSALSSIGSDKKPVVIDFSIADLAFSHLAAAKKYGSGLLLSTTGHDEAINPALREASTTIPVVFAPNTSLMANLMAVLSQAAARCLKNADAAIIDLHHAQKQDAPSGTAKALAKAIRDAGGNGGKEIPISSLRHGTVAGEHTVCFFNNFERLEIVHRAEDRRVFAEGALVAAQFLQTCGPGLYDMKDVLKMNWL